MCFGILVGDEFGDEGKLGVGNGDFAAYGYIGVVWFLIGVG